MTIVNNVQVKERVKAKMSQMGFTITPNIERLIDRNMKPDFDADRVMSAVIDEMMEAVGGA